MCEVVPGGGEGDSCSAYGYGRMSCLPPLHSRAGVGVHCTAGGYMAEIEELAVLKPRTGGEGGRRKAGKGGRGGGGGEVM